MYDCYIKYIREHFYSGESGFAYHRSFGYHMNLVKVDPDKNTRPLSNPFYICFPVQVFCSDLGVPFVSGDGVCVV